MQFDDATPAAVGTVGRESNVEISEHDRIDHRPIGIDGRQELARERRFISARRGVRRVKHFSEGRRPALPAFEELVELILPIPAAPHFIESIEPLPERRVGTYVACVSGAFGATGTRRGTVATLTAPRRSFLRSGGWSLAHQSFVRHPGDDQPAPAPESACIQHFRDAVDDALFLVAAEPQRRRVAQEDRPHCQPTSPAMSGIEGERSPRQCDCVLA